MNPRSFTFRRYVRFLACDIFFLGNKHGQAFALLISPLNGVPPLDPLPAVKHSVRVADEACRAIHDKSLHVRRPPSLLV